ncbi:MAG: sodium-dependent transporter [Halioglobus sp.]|nr:sodium-dependent transporter [Halioglobus sp.]
MADPNAPVRWGSRTTFVLALSASAVGLGNLWRFSYLSGEYGGGAFVISYVLCLFLIAAPVMVAEVVLGRYGGSSPVAAIRRACDGSLRSRGWTLVGALACLTSVLMLSLYIVVAGWGMAYAGFMQAGVFSAARAAEVGEHFAQFLAEPMQQVYWQSLFLLVASGIIVLGVRRGLGVLVWLAVPALLAMLAFLIKYGFDYGDIAATRNFLFSTRLVDFSGESVLVALGHALFTLGVGVGTGISYGAYAPQRIPIGRSIFAVAVFDSVLALLAGLAIFPIVFANNMEPNAGPGLLFISLPYAFGNLMQGELAGAVFFLLVVLAALGSAVALMEPVVAMLMQLARLERFTAALIVGAVVWLLGLAVVMSLQPGQGWAGFGERNLLGVFDMLTARILLPLVALLVTLLVGWRLRPEILRLELARESALFFSLWRFLLRYIAPLAIALLMLAPLRAGGV